MGQRVAADPKQSICRPAVAYALSWWEEMRWSSRFLQGMWILFAQKLSGWHQVLKLKGFKEIKSRLHQLPKQAEGMKRKKWWVRRKSLPKEGRAEVQRWGEQSGALGPVPMKASLPCHRMWLLSLILCGHSFYTNPSGFHSSPAGRLSERIIPWI